MSSIKKYPKFDFSFSSLGTRGTPGALRVGGIKKLQITESGWRPILGGPLFKKC